ncbi:hypothetical protein AB0K16_51435 [Nonomuraea jabiensis]
MLEAVDDERRRIERNLNVRYRRQFAYVDGELAEGERTQQRGTAGTNE